MNWTSDIPKGDLPHALDLAHIQGFPSPLPLLKETKRDYLDINGTMIKFP